MCWLRALIGCRLSQRDLCEKTVMVFGKSIGEQLQVRKRYSVYRLCVPPELSSREPSMDIYETSEAFTVLGKASRGLCIFKYQ